MKKNLMWMLVLSVWTMLYACSDNDNELSEVSLTVAPNKVEFSAEGGSQELAVITTAEAWTVSSDAEWCKVVQDGAKLTVTAEAHNDVELRTAKVTVKAERAVDQIVEVRQSGAAPAALELAVEGEVVDELELEFLAKKEESQMIAITTNQAIVAVDTAETALWCKVTLAEDNASLSVVCDVNSEPERETTFKVVAGTESNKAEKTVTVKQANGSFKIELSMMEVTLNALGNRVFVTANVDVKVQSNETWCTAMDKNFGSMGKEFLIFARPNFGGTDREAVVTVSLPDGSETHELKVLQTSETMNRGEIFNYLGKPVGLIISNENNKISIIALEEKDGLQWSTKEDNLGMTYGNSFTEMLNKVKEVDPNDWKTNYPVFGYCADMEEKTGLTGWCIPETAIGGNFSNGYFRTVEKNLDELNTKLEEGGYPTLKTFRYWTCSELQEPDWQKGHISIWFFTPYPPYDPTQEASKTSTKTEGGSIIKARCFWSITY